MSVHIGIDAHTIGARQAGNETYVKNLIPALAELDSENRYTLFFTQKQAADEWRSRFANFSVQLILAPTPIVRVPVALALELRRRPVDVLHVQFTAPPFCRVPVVATIHDLSFEHLPETFTRRGRFQLRLTVRSTAQLAARVATASDYSRQDLIRTYGLRPEKIAVTYYRVDSRYTPNPASDKETPEARRRFRIERDFVLAVGSLQPRKNLVRLIHAYARLRAEQEGFAHQLVIVGRPLWLFREVFAAIERQPWARDIIVTGYVADEELPVLYRAAAVLVYPSLLEGFGLPPLEAMACGTPVVASSTSCFPEILGDAAVLVDPYDEVALARAILTSVSDERLRGQLREAGLARARRFTWRATAEKTLALYRESLRVPAQSLQRPAGSTLR